MYGSSPKERKSGRERSDGADEAKRRQTQVEGGDREKAIGPHRVCVDGLPQKITIKHAADGRTVEVEVVIPEERVRKREKKVRTRNPNEVFVSGLMHEETSERSQRYVTQVGEVKRAATRDGGLGLVELRNPEEAKETPAYQRCAMGEKSTERRERRRPETEPGNDEQGGATETVEAAWIKWAER